MMPRAVVVDSSVAFKWLQPGSEDGFEQAARLLGLHREGEISLAAPTLLRLEVANAYWKRGATAADLLVIGQVLEGYCINWFEISAALAADASRIAGDHRLTVYDATFIALALHLDAELITEDRALLRSGACLARALTEQG